MPKATHENMEQSAHSSFGIIAACANSVASYVVCECHSFKSCVNIFQTHEITCVLVASACDFFVLVECLFSFWFFKKGNKKSVQREKKTNLQVYWSRNFCTLFSRWSYTVHCTHTTFEKRTVDMTDWPCANSDHVLLSSWQLFNISFKIYIYFEGKVIF